MAVPEKTIGLDKRSRLHLWVVPARVDGLWCGAGGLALRLEQGYQTLQATQDQGGERRHFSGRIDGRQLRMLGGGGEAWSATVDGDGLQLTATSGRIPAATAAAGRLRRATGTTCP